MQEDAEGLSASKLNGLIKQKRNAEFKSTVLSKVSDPNSAWIRDPTLLHTAAMFNNFEIVAFLTALGANVDSRNALGQTPLLVAILHKQFQTVQLLLSLDADIFANDAENTSILQICFQEEGNVPDYIIMCIFERLKRSGLPAEQIADKLMKSDCSVDEVLFMCDAEVTGVMLDYKTSFVEYESRALLTRAMNLRYLENVRVLLHRGPEAVKRRSMFLDLVIKDRFDPNVRPFFEQIVNWDVVDECYLPNLAKLFSREDEATVRMFLDINIDEYVRNKFGCELIVDLFANNKIDHAKILRGRQFDVNSFELSGEWNALHLAVDYQNEKAIKYLLDSGADPNIPDCRGSVPLFTEMDSELFDLLVEAGADVQVCIEGETLLDVIDYHLVIPKIAILEARGVPILQVIRNWIDAYRCYFDLYQYHLQELNLMKTYAISETNTLFSVLTDNVESIMRYIRDEETLREVTNVIRKHRVMSTYASTMLRKMHKAVRIRKLRDKAAAILSSAMQIFEPDHLVIVKIVSYLRYVDLLALDEESVG